jgi:hypothetical protein
MQAADLLEATGNDALEDREGRAVSPETMICVEPWPRAVLADRSAVLSDPVATHLIFGFTGAPAATSVWRSWQKRSR